MTKVKTLEFMKFIFKLATRHKAVIKDAQIKKGFTKQRIVRIHFVDQEKFYDLKVVEGEVSPVNPISSMVYDPEVEVFIEEFCTLKHLRLGVKMGVHPSSGRPEPMAYTLLSAWSFGDISSSGNTSTNEVISIVDIFIDLVNLIPEDDIIQLVGSCDHDVKEG